MSIRSKKGETLVEVMASLTIIMLVLTSVLTLVFTTMDLLQASRMKTMAVAAAQKGMAIYISAIGTGSSCMVGTALSHGDKDYYFGDSDHFVPEGETLKGGQINPGINVTVDERTPYMEEDETGQDNSVGDLTTIVATATWSYKGNDQSYVLTQVVRWAQ